MDRMELVRYRSGQEIAYGLVVVGRLIYSLASELWAQPRLGRAVASLDEVQLLAPCQPSKVVAVGLGGVVHAAESSAQVPAEPFFFLKPPGAAIGPGATISYPEHLSHWPCPAGRSGRRGDRRDWQA